MSERVRVNTKSSTAISTSASPMSGASPVSVASLYSSSTITGRQAAHAQRALVRGRHLIDLAFGVRDPLVARIVQTDVGDCDRCAVGVGAGHRVEGRPDLRDVADGVDLGL